MRIILDNMHDPDVAPVVDEEAPADRADADRRLGDLWNQHFGHTANRGWRARLIDDDGTDLFTIDGEDDPEQDAATEAGEEAALAGASRDSCPYDDDDELQPYWLDGFDNADT